MKKILLATTAAASLLAATLTALPAHADELPAAPVPTASSGSDTGAPPQKRPEFKVDFNWTIPANEVGDPYTTCNVQLIRADGTVANEAPFPASIPTVTYKLDAGETHDESFTPGLSTVSLAYTCSNPAGDTSALQRIDSVVIPDVVPTAPAYVEVEDPDSLYPTVSFGGSEALGVAQLEGYKVEVTNGSMLVSSNYTPVANASARGAARMQAKAVAQASNALSTQLSELPSGMYKVHVMGKNAIGLSQATSTEVLVNSTKVAAPVQLVKSPGHVRSIKAATTKSGATVTWQAPANNAATKYSVKVAGAGKVKTYAVGAKRTVKITGLKKNTRYNVWVTATGTLPQLTSLTLSHFTTKKR